MAAGQVNKADVFRRRQNASFQAADGYLRISVSQTDGAFRCEDDSGSEFFYFAPMKICRTPTEALQWFHELCLKLRLKPNWVNKV